MDKSIQSFKKDLATLRTGRANSNMLDIIRVDVYGQLMPIEQLGTVSVPEARLISIQVWDKSNTTLIVGMNGSGKSTLLDALCFGLFNRPFRIIKKEQMINTINQCDCDSI